MSGGEIAAIIAAVALLVFVLALAYPIIKAGLVLDEVRFTVHDLSRDVPPLIQEATETLAIANRELDKLDGVTTKVVNLAGRLASLGDAVTAAAASPLGKFAAFATGVAGKHHNKAKKNKAKKD